MDHLEAHAKIQKIIVSHRVVLPDFLDDENLDSELNETFKQIESTPRVNVIVSFAKPNHMFHCLRNSPPTHLDVSGSLMIVGLSQSKC